MTYMNDIYLTFTNDYIEIWLYLEFWLTDYFLYLNKDVKILFQFHVRDQTKHTTGTSLFYAQALGAYIYITHTTQWQSSILVSKGVHQLLKNLKLHKATAVLHYWSRFNTIFYFEINLYQWLSGISYTQKTKTLCRWQYHL